MSVFNYDKDADGIVTVTMDMTGPVNMMNEEYRVAMGETLAKLESEQNLTGVVFASAKKVFFAGGDINMLMTVDDDNKTAFFDTLEDMKSQLRRIEKLPVPVVAAINGAALGGGYEIALACNHRIALNLPSTVVGLPEVSLGLLPGGGGIVRMVNKFGLEKALPYLLEGKRLDVESALDQGLVDEIVTSAEELITAAKRYILQNKGSAEAAVQPWDREGFKIPGGNANNPKLAMLLAAAPAMLLAKTKGKYPAPKEILDVAVEAARLDFDTALRVESRGLVYLAMTPQAKKMMADFFKPK